MLHDPVPVLSVVNNWKLALPEAIKSRAHSSYETIATKGSFMGKFGLGITDTSKRSNSGKIID
jgi:hypothetical protein